MFILAIDDDPAKASGMLCPGDEIVGVSGQSLIDHTYQECLRALRAVQGDATLTIFRNNSDFVTHQHTLGMTEHTPPVSSYNDTKQANKCSSYPGSWRGVGL